MASVIVVYRIIIVKNPTLRRGIRASLPTAIYGNNRMFHCLLSSSQGLIRL